MAKKDWQLTHFIAWRYLFARKQYNVINMVSGVAAVAIAVIAMALVVVLSVYNGYEKLIMSKLNTITPPLVIQQRDNQVFDIKQLEPIVKHSDVKASAGLLHTKGLIRVEGKQLVAAFLGLAPSFEQVSNVKEWDVIGKLAFTEGQLNMGIALASALDIIPDNPQKIQLVLPKRKGIINPLFPSSAFMDSQGTLSSIVSAGDEKYDYTLFLSLEQLQNLMQRLPGEVDQLAVAPAETIQPQVLQRRLKPLLPKGFVILDQVEQQPEVTRLVALEKWISFLILSFILLLAAFNVMAGITMLMIEKQEDRQLLRAMGATPAMIARIFRYEGLLISGLGAVIGVIIGIALVLSQHYWGWLTTTTLMGPEPYPVVLKPLDVVATLAVVLLIGYAASLYPTRKPQGLSQTESK